jgi:hypothetical protein
LEEIVFKLKEEMRRKEIEIEKLEGEKQRFEDKIDKMEGQMDCNMEERKQILKEVD